MSKYCCFGGIKIIKLKKKDLLHFRFFNVYSLNLRNEMLIKQICKFINLK